VPTSCQTSLMGQNLPRSFTLGSATSAVQSRERNTALWDAMRSSSELGSGGSTMLSPASLRGTHPVDYAKTSFKCSAFVVALRGPINWAGKECVPARERRPKVRKIPKRFERALSLFASCGGRHCLPKLHRHITCRWSRWFRRWPWRSRRRWLRSRLRRLSDLYFSLVHSNPRCASARPLRLWSTHPTQHRSIKRSQPVAPF
jgi:hypothetical protein